MKTIIHINQHIIKSNRKNNVTEPVLTCKSYKVKSVTTASNSTYSNTGSVVTFKSKESKDAETIQRVREDIKQNAEKLYW